MVTGLCRDKKFLNKLFFLLTCNVKISQIRSDNDETMMLHYTLRGPGANQPPVGYFIVDTYKGLVHITQPLDREERQNYTVRITNI